MKNVGFLFFISILSLPVFATEPSEDMRSITEALINSPNLTSKLKAKATDYLRDYKIVKITDGVVYKLNFQNNSHHCEPCGAATATIWERWDSNQSHMPTTYKSKFKHIPEGIE